MKWKEEREKNAERRKREKMLREEIEKYEEKEQETWKAEWNRILSEWKRSMR